MSFSVRLAVARGGIRAPTSTRTCVPPYRPQPLHALLLRSSPDRTCPSKRWLTPIIIIGTARFIHSTAKPTQSPEDTDSSDTVHTRNQSRHQYRRGLWALFCCFFLFHLGYVKHHQEGRLAQKETQQQLERTVAIWRDLKLARKTGDERKVRAAVFAAARHWSSADVEVVDLGPLERGSLVGKLSRWLRAPGAGGTQLDLVHETRVFACQRKKTGELQRVIVAVNAEMDDGLMGVLVERFGANLKAALLARQRDRPIPDVHPRQTAVYNFKPQPSSPSFEVLFLLREEQGKIDLAEIPIPDFELSSPSRIGPRGNAAGLIATQAMILSVICGVGVMEKMYKT